NEARETEAVLTATASLSTPGAVLVKAEATNRATADAPGGVGGGVSIAIMVPIALVTGDTRARVDGDITSSTGITVQAIGENVAEAHVIVIGVSVIGITGAVATAQVDSDVEAIVGSSSSLASSRLVRVEAKLKGDKNKVEAEALAGSFGGIGTFSIMGGVATLNGDVRAQLDGDVTAHTSVVVIGGFASVSGSRTLATLNGDDEALIGATSQVTSAGAVHVNATGVNVATADS